MNSPKSKLGLVSLALMLPALFLCVSGILYVTFDVEAANRLLDELMTYPLLKLLLSPVVVLGGPFAAFALNVWKVVHLSAEVINEEFVIALSVKRLFAHWVCLALAGGLLLLLVAYAFVENFKIVAR
jgi:hypothetical protein